MFTPIFIRTPSKMTLMTTRTDADWQRAFERIQAGIRSCTACLQAGYIDRAMPIFQGHTGHRMMIIGQAPAHRTV